MPWTGSTIALGTVFFINRPNKAYMYFNLYIVSTEEICIID